MSSVNGSTWKDWLIGVMIPINFALVAYIWNTSEKSSIRIEGDFRGMIEDVAEVKAEVKEINRRLERIERERSAPREGQLFIPEKSLSSTTWWDSIATLK